MAEYLVTDAELTASANAIRNKVNNSDPVEWVKDTGFASAINSIPSGGNVQITDGSYTSSSYPTTVDCGFKPDFVVIYLGEIWDSNGVSYVQRTSFTFDEITDEYSFLNSLMYSADPNTGEFTWVVDVWAQRTDSGFLAAHQFINLGNGASYDSPCDLSYIAIKYT